MRWELKQGDTSTKESLEVLMSKFADDVEWVRKDRQGFSRTLGFKILNRYYEIMWYNNNCKLFVGGIEDRPLQASFNAIFTDVCHPICFDGNDNLSFENEGKVILRIPLKDGALRGVL